MINESVVTLPWRNAGVEVATSDQWRKVSALSLLALDFFVCLRHA